MYHHLMRQAEQRNRSAAAAGRGAGAAGGPGGGGARAGSAALERVVWVNRERESFLPYDLYVCHADESVTYVEVKVGWEAWLPAIARTIDVACRSSQHGRLACAHDVVTDRMCLSWCCVVSWMNVKPESLRTCKPFFGNSLQASASWTKDLFEISLEELKFAEEQGDAYEVYRVRGVVAAAGSGGVMGQGQGYGGGGRYGGRGQLQQHQQQQQPDIVRLANPVRMLRKRGATLMLVL